MGYGGHSACYLMSYGILTGDKEGGAGFRMSGALHLHPLYPFLA